MYKRQVGKIVPGQKIKRPAREERAAEADQLPDVYKRQGFILDTLCGKTYAISPRSFYQVNPAQTAVLYGLAAVSYTHLDVYKRQSLVRA